MASTRQTNENTDCGRIRTGASVNKDCVVTRLVAVIRAGGTLIALGPSPIGREPSTVSRLQGSTAVVHLRCASFPIESFRRSHRVNRRCTRGYKKVEGAGVQLSGAAMPVTERRVLTLGTCRRTGIALPQASRTIAITIAVLGPNISFDDDG